MNVSYKWLSQHVDLSGFTPEEVANKLTFAGAEVEGLSRLASGTNLVIGEILSCTNHPDSDHLHVLSVDEGPFGIHQIVCGAPNARKGLKVIVARTGAKLPQVEIKPSTIRGVESDGMCCSLLELGVDPKFLTDYQKAGIEELPLDAPVGESDVLGYLGLDDTILEVSVLPNRPDLYAWNNIAREVGALLERPVTLEEPKAPKTVSLPVEVGSNAKGCPLFTGRVVHGIENKQAPEFMKRALEAAGIRSISAVVDIGNYAMLLTGQPLNMYDADKLPASSLIVRDDLEGTFLAMDDNEYPIERGDLVVTSNDKPMCLAGVMTAKECMVDENTKNLIVEAAYFFGAPIRHTSNRIGLTSDSSMRYCKGINPHQAEEVQNLVAELLERYCGAKEFGQVASFDEMDHSQKKIAVDEEYINGRLGTSFSKDLIVRTLNRVGFVCKEEGSHWNVLVPSYRIDIDGKADLAEEVIRLLGYENVPSVLPRVDLALTGLTPKQVSERDIRRHLTYLGLDEVVTYTLVSKEEAKKFAYLEKGEPYVLTNPMTVEREVVRTNLLHSLLLVATFNANRQSKSGAFFEVSDIDSKSRKGRHLGIVLYGDKPTRLGQSVASYDFFDMKGIVSSLLESYGLNEMRYRLEPWSLGGKELHPYQTAEIRLGKNLLGYFGVLHPNAAKDYDLKSAVVLELDLDMLLDTKVSPIVATTPPRFPSVTRDLALLVPQGVSYESLRREALRASSIIRAVEAFDLYRGEGVEEGYISLAIRLTLLDEEHTLSEAEVAAATKKALDALSVKFGAKIRQ